MWVGRGLGLWWLLVVGRVEDGVEGEGKRRDVLPGLGLICQFLCIGWHPRMRVRVTMR